MAEQADHQCEADRGFRRGHGHHEEGDDLAIDLAQLATEGDKRQVDGVQHDLDRQQQRDQIAPQEHAGRADREQQARQHQVVANRHGHQSLLRASTTAPTIDTMIRIDVTSNANMYFVNSTTPSSATDDFAGRSPIGPARPVVRDSAQPSSRASNSASAPPMRTAMGRYSGCERSHSAASSRGTLSSITVNRNSTMMAPA